MFKLQKAIFFYLIVNLVFLSGQLSFAKEIIPKDNHVELYKSDIVKVENYLNNIQDFSAKFMQLSADGELSQGLFYLSRPGKMRIEYLGQNNILIVVNGAVLAYKDLELDETSYLTTNSTPASFLTRKNISFFAKDIEITEVSEVGGQIKISLLKKNRQDAGEFSLIFNIEPLQFLKMEVKNDLGEIVSVSLEDINFSPKIDSKLFVIKNQNLP
jgi:outer membrane lipoprotein-sorting protein